MTKKAQTFRELSTMPANAWSDIAYGGGKWVAVGASGATYQYGTSSDNGVTWTTGTISGGYTANVAYGNGQFLYLTNGGSRVYYSSNGTAWSSSDLGIGGGNFRHAAYGNGIWVALQDSSSSYATSTDGAAWTRRTLPDTMPYNSTSRLIMFVNGQFVVLGQSYSMISTDGISWTTYSLPSSSGSGPWGAFGYVRNTYFAYTLGGYYRITSPDAQTWTRDYIPGYFSEYSASLGGICTGNGVSVMPTSYSNNYLLSSIDGVNWTSRYKTDAGTKPTVTNAAFNGSVFIGVRQSSPYAVYSAITNESLLPFIDATP